MIKVIWSNGKEYIVECMDELYRLADLQIYYKKQGFGKFIMVRIEPAKEGK